MNFSEPRASQPIAGRYQEFNDERGGGTGGRSTRCGGSRERSAMTCSRDGEKTRPMTGAATKTRLSAHAVQHSFGPIGFMGQCIGARSVGGMVSVAIALWQQS
jgi:hypothetical protein